MKQKLLTDIELDVHELKYLMESFSKESTQTLSELLKRSITRMQGHLDELLQDVDTVCESLPPSPIVEEYKESDTFVAEPEPPVVEETIEEEEEEPVADESVTEESVFIEDEVSKPTVLGESIKLSAGGLRQSISLNDSFRFSRELFASRGSGARLSPAGPRPAAHVPRKRYGFSADRPHRCGDDDCGLDGLIG